MLSPKGVPIREFRDSRGVDWRVWPTQPGQRGAHPKALDGGWLTFECEDAKRRIVPIPDGWEYVPVDQLEQLCESAEEFKPARRTSPTDGVRRDAAPD